MGEFRSGEWIVGLLIYFIFFFLIVSSTIGSKIALGTADSIDGKFTDPGFQDRFSTFSNLSQEKCTGSGGGRSANFLGNIQCNQLNIDNTIESVCNNITGCLWLNYTSILGLKVADQECTGFVNKTFYNIEGTFYNYCQSESLKNDQILCNILKCDWINLSDYGSEISVNEKNPVVIWETISFVTGFNADIGLGRWQWIFSLFFFYIPFMMMIWAVYMALPFLH